MAQALAPAAVAQRAEWAAAAAARSTSGGGWGDRRVRVRVPSTSVGRPTFPPLRGKSKSSRIRTARRTSEWRDLQRCDITVGRAGPSSGEGVVGAAAAWGVLCDIDGVLVEGKSQVGAAKQLGQLGVLLDLDGVLYPDWRSHQAMEGAVSTVKWVKDNHIPHLFLTNTTTNTTEGLATKLGAMGISCSPDQILTPARATCAWLVQHQKDRVALFADPSLTEEFRDFTLVDTSSSNEMVDAVVMGDMGTGWDYVALNTVFRMLMENPSTSLVALGKTRYFQDTDSKLSLDVGPLAAAMEYATGKESVVLGKPDRIFFNLGAGLLGMDPEDVVMIGDDVRSDVKGAQDADMRGVLVKTGKFRKDDLQLGIRPDAVLRSIADFPTWYMSQSG